MKAVIFDGVLHVGEVRKPERKPSEALIKVVRAGICNTDHEIIKGYVSGFNAIPGHEFTGIVEDSDSTALIGQRVVGEINITCGICSYCKAGKSRHCINRTVLGIRGKDGAFAEYVTLPERNLHILPDSVTDEIAVFIEPLAAALRIRQQVRLSTGDDLLIIGDGKLAILIALALSKEEARVTVLGKHPHKLACLTGTRVTTVTLNDFVHRQYDMVVEATGNPTAFELALGVVKSAGIIVLKSTYSDRPPVDLSSIVTKEITVIGSRCGDFKEAINFLTGGFNIYPEDDLTHYLRRMITGVFPIQDALRAFELSSNHNSLKVHITM